ncbi:MAG: hypothetical protein ABSE82_02815 [Nitrososphaerales archaeon]
MKNRLILISLMAVFAMGVLGVAVAANLASTTTTDSMNTLTLTSYTVTTQFGTATVTDPTQTQTSTLIVQPVVGLTSTITTVVSTSSLQTTTTTTTPFASTSTTVTAGSTLFTPFVMYWVSFNSGNYYRSLAPINIGSVISSSIDGSGNVHLDVALGNGSYVDDGFYYVVTLGTLTSGHGLIINGTGFGVNIWLINTFLWAQVSYGVDRYVGSGIYGLDDTVGTTTINGTTTFSNFNGSGACSGSLSVSQLAGGTCGASPSTPVAIWVGITNSPTPNAATITSMYTS